MIVITGATGNTGKPAVEALLAKGEKVRVLGRDGIKLKPLADAGAEPFVANVEDAASLSKAFEGATAAYLVIPQNTHVEDFRAYQERVTDAYASAVASARVPYVVTLSSTGAQHSEKSAPSSACTIWKRNSIAFKASMFYTFVRLISWKIFSYIFSPSARWACSPAARPETCHFRGSPRRTSAITQPAA